MSDEEGRSLWEGRGLWEHFVTLCVMKLREMTLLSSSKLLTFGFRLQAFGFFHQHNQWLCGAALSPSRYLENKANRL